MTGKVRLILMGCMIIATIGLIIWAVSGDINWGDDSYSDGVEQIDLNTINLTGSGVEVHFSDVILSDQKETRQLIVSEQEGTVSMELKDKLVNKLDFDFLTKTQKVSYTGTGYFVVDLDKLTKDSIIQDDENKTVTIKIDHAYLKTVDIDPNKVTIGDVKEGLLARGDIELTLQDYNTIEKELRSRLVEKFDTVQNGQKADEIALSMVKKVFGPIVNAVDDRYNVVVEFK